MNDPKLKRTSVQIKYTSTDGFSAEFGGKSGAGTRHRVTGEEVPPKHALIAGFEELARLAALFGFEAEARQAADDAFKRVAEWRKMKDADKC